MKGCSAKNCVTRPSYPEIQFYEGVLCRCSPDEIIEATETRVQQEQSDALWQATADLDEARETIEKLHEEFAQFLQDEGGNRYDDDKDYPANVLESVYGRWMDKHDTASSYNAICLHCAAQHEFRRNSDGDFACLACGCVRGVAVRE